MNNFSEMDKTIIEKECTRKSAKDIAFLLDKPVKEVASFLETYCQANGIVSFQQSLNEKLKARRPREAKKKEPKIISRLLPGEAAKPNEGRLRRRDAEKAIEAKLVHFSSMLLVRIDEKTQVYAKPGESEDECRRRYQANRINGGAITPADRTRETNKRKAS